MLLPPRTGLSKGINLVACIRKLAMAGEQAGFTIEEMIELLNAGLPVGTLLDVIAMRLDSKGRLAPESQPTEYQV